MSNSSAVLQEVNCIIAGDPNERYRLNTSIAAVKCHKGRLAYTTPKSHHKTRSQSKDPFVLTDRKRPHKYEWKVVSGHAFRELSDRASAYPSYTYEQLSNEKTIRLMEIEPSQDRTSTVECCLKVVSLASAPSYEALSYRWGKKDDRYLRCGGESLSIRRNLEDVLKRLRNTHTQRVIWTDAICINQEDPKEKEGQLKLMREIYSKAARVLIWLGEDVEGKAEQAFDRIESLALPKYDTPIPIDPWWNPVAAFYSCAWFSRLWVFQEIAMAISANVLWGSFTIAWKTVGYASTQIRTRHYQAILYYSMWNVYNAYLFWKWSTIGGYQHQRETFVYMLQVTRNLDCTVQKDRIVALSAFATVDTIADEFSECYGRTRAVYRRFARGAFEKMQTLDLLSAVQHGSALCSSTWIPKWHICTAHTLAPLGSGLKGYDACRNLPPCSISWTGNWEQFLRVTGIEFDIITKERRVMARSDSVVHLRATLAQVLNQLFLDLTAYPTGEAPDQVACLTLIANKDWYGMIVEDKDMTQHLADFDAFWASMRHVTARRPPRSLCHTSGNADRFLLAAHSACGGRRLFHTSKGYLGLGPALLQAGDLVCVLAGGAIPFVLRQDARSSPSKRRFKLVGEAYVHGIMHREATGQCTIENSSTISFTII
ncbi:HET-domain-containing protein [Ophiobolus disseminans]|uniref:HET-domain-containing protein n=1 Tax=Ophiobolus disseminans TaxID=1469910 RepID=A0A6A6ZDD7_9PLEO|nr:HET-domain-containing protein [Ophiobolus disseminans]